MEECFKLVEKRIHAMFYQRLLDSQDKISVATKIQTTEPKLDPYLDFQDISIE